MTRSYLLRQPGVVAAEVWLKNGVMLARVTVIDACQETGADLRLACRLALGESQTPMLLMLDLVSQAEQTA